MTKVLGILGAGAMGTALGMVAARAGTPSLLWTISEEVATSINKQHINPERFPEVELSPLMRATTHLQDLKACDLLLLTIPAQTVRQVVKETSEAFPLHQGLLLAAKGLELKTGLLMSEVLAEVAPTCPLGVLSGPNFAAEMIRGLPTASLWASTDETLSQAVVNIFSNPDFRLYTSTDIIGAQIGGAFKNVLAIASGIAAGSGFGYNAQAVIITRGLAEMARFGVARGAHPVTFQGLSGLGDLCLTAYGPLSRNFTFGRRIGEGYTVSELRANMSDLAEGYYTCSAVIHVARELGLELPLTEALYRILFHNASLNEVKDALLARPLRAE